MILIFTKCLFSIDGHICTDSVNFNRIGNHKVGQGRLAIIPRLNFTCNGRITSIVARVDRRNSRNVYPIFQVWRLSSPASMIYNRIGEVQQQENHSVSCMINTCTTTIPLTGNSRIEFNSGDVIGYYHPSNTQYQVVTLRTTGYIQYQFVASLTTADLSNADRSDDDRQPLMQFEIGNHDKYVYSD